MKKLSYVLAALATIAVGVPTIASATEFGVRIGGDRDYYVDRDYRRARVSSSMDMTGAGIAAGTITTMTATAAS